MTSLSLALDALVPFVAPNATAAQLWSLPDRPTDPIPYMRNAYSLARWPVKGYLEKYYSDLTFTTVYETNIATGVKVMAIKGYGVAWIPSFMVADDQENGRFVRATGNADDTVVDNSIIVAKIFTNRKSRHAGALCLKSR